MKSKMTIIEIYLNGRKREWRWRMRDFQNGLKIGASTESYKNRHAAVTNLKRITGISYVPHIPYGVKNLQWVVTRHADGSVAFIGNTNKRESERYQEGI